MAGLLPYVALVALGVAILVGGIWLGMLLGRRLDRLLPGGEESTMAEEKRAVDG